MYSRETELRKLLPNDVYTLGVILDDNNCWKKLMEVIPKELNADSSRHLNWEQSVGSFGLKYNNDHIRLIENAIKRSGESRLYSQILFDEWGTSGRKHERPTVGVLLQLLVKAELYRAAEYVATTLLNEPAPPRPLNGPAAIIDISLSDEIFNDVEPYVNDSAFYPDTEALNDNANGAMSMVDNNKDYYTKYQCIDKQVNMLNHIQFTPKPPPRPLRTARLQVQQQQQQLQLQQEQSSHMDVANQLVSTVEANVRRESPHDESARDREEIVTNSSSLNIPNISALMTNSQTISVGSTQHSSTELVSQHTESTNLSEDAIIPNISLLAMGMSSATPSSADVHATTEHEILPLISELNVKGDHTRSTNSTTEPSTNFPDITASPFRDSRDPLSRSSSSLSNVSIDYDNGDDDDDDVDEDDEADDDDDDVDLPDVVPNIVGDDIAVDCDVDDDDDENSLPNLSLLRQRNANNDNDSSLTTVTGTSGENSFELSMNDCSSTSNENIPCLSELKP